MADESAPVRKFLRFEDWPEPDRLAWLALFAEGETPAAFHLPCKNSSGEGIGGETGTTVFRFDLFREE